MRKDTKKTELLAPLSEEEVKKTIFSSYGVDSEVQPALSRLRNSLIRGKQLSEETRKDINTVAYGFETEMQMMLMESFSDRYQAGAKNLCRELIKDYACETTAEKALAEAAAAAFMRYLDASRRLNNVFDVDIHITPNKTAYMAMLSKERDRSHRQYLATIISIKQHKAPPIEMTIRAKTAFIAGNQQINGGNPPTIHNDPD